LEIVNNLLRSLLQACNKLQGIVCREAFENLRDPIRPARKVKLDIPENLSFMGVNTHL
jgi:hypothetical protein